MKQYKGLGKKILSVSILAGTVLTGCEKEKIPLVGEREAVLMPVSRIVADAEASKTPVVLPQAVVNQDWPQVGGHPSHAMPAVSLGHPLKLLWSNTSLEGSGSDRRLLSGPVTNGQYVYALGTDGYVVAVRLSDGEVIWRCDIVPEEGERSLLGGGVAYAQGHVLVTAPFNQVLCLDAQTGDIKWRQSVNSPVRAAPTVRDGRVFVISINNELDVLDMVTGKRLWGHTGMVESAGLLGGANPAVGEGVVVVPYSSGEVYALRVENGYQLWSDSLFASRQLDAVSTMAQIKARPIIDRGVVYVASHGGRMVAIDVRSGRRLWDMDIAVTRTPAVVSDYIFVMTLQNDLLCLSRDSGRVKWVRALPKGEDKPIDWAGPIVADDTLILTGTDGRILQLSAVDGRLVGEARGEASIKLSPIIANRTLVVLTDNGTLAAYHS